MITISGKKPVFTLFILGLVNLLLFTFLLFNSKNSAYEIFSLLLVILLGLGLIIYSITMLPFKIELSRDHINFNFLLRKKLKLSISGHIPVIDQMNLKKNYVYSVKFHKIKLPGLSRIIISSQNTGLTINRIKEELDSLYLVSC